jgi:hypothetical protein
MPSSVNRHRRQHAFTRGFDRPQGSNPYANAILAALWQRGREKRLAQSGGVMPPLPKRSPSDVRPPAKMPPRPGQGKSSPPGRGRPGQHRGWR